MNNSSQPIWIILFVWSFSSHSRMFHSYGDITITGKRLQILTYTPPSWPMSSERSLACLTYCDKGHSFIMVISEDPWHSHLLPSVWQWRCFNDLSLSQLGFEHPTFRMWGKCSNWLCHHCANCNKKENPNISVLHLHVLWLKKG